MSVSIALYQKMEVIVRRKNVYSKALCGEEEYCVGIYEREGESKSGGRVNKKNRYV